MKKYHHPIIVGAGQLTDHDIQLERAPHPLLYAKMAIEKCVEDSESRTILDHVNIMSMCNSFTWGYKDPAGMLCEMLGIKPERAEYTHIGGNTPQWLVNRAADMIAAGEIDVALLTGAEALYTLRKARQAMVLPPWPPKEPVSVEMIGDGRMGSNPQELLHGAAFPIQVYPLFENALRHSRGLSMDAHREFISALLAGFSKTASKNNLSWFPAERSSSGIREITPDNRMIGFPYTKLMNPVMDVNQAAALLITHPEMADKLSIPRNKWIYIHGGADATDKWFVSERVNYTSSPAIEAVASASLEMAGIGIKQIDFFDLYSCFPCATVIGAKSLGLDIDNLPALTITGGLPYFGGAGNNYTMHSIAEAVSRLRNKPEQFGYITALGWYLTKHSAGVYSGREPERPWNREGQKNLQKKIDAMASPVLCESPDGRATVETYTVMHDSAGSPDYSIVIARLTDGRRCWAQTEEDCDLLIAMEREEFIGREGDISLGRDVPNIIRF